MPSDATGGPGVAPRPCRLIILAALPLEVWPFLRRVQARPLMNQGLRAWEFAGGTGVAAISGMGAAAATRAVEHLLSLRPAEVLVVLGFGGGLTAELAPGALVLGESFWDYDPAGQVLTPIPTPTAPLPLPLLVRRLQEHGLTAFSGSLVTTPGIIHKGRGGTAIQHLPYPVLDLETGTVATAAAARGLSFLGIRAITDTAGEEIPEFLAQAGSSDSGVGPGAALRWLAADPRRLATLIHFWRRARKAATHLAAALTVLLPLLLKRGGQFEGQPG